MIKTNLTIGIKDYSLTLANTCVDDPQCEQSVKISFSLEGDFLGAATSDNINLTVDYEQLCHFLVRRLEKPTDLSVNNLKFLIKAFSPLINNGLVMLEVRCAHAFIKDQCPL